MKFFKWLGILAIVYIAFVFVLEGFILGYLQPNSVPDYLKDRVDVVVLRTTDSSGGREPPASGRLRNGRKALCVGPSLAAGLVPQRSGES